MKKLLLIVAMFAGLFSGGVAAHAGTLEFGYCGEIGGMLGEGNAPGTSYGGALEIPVVTAKTFEGCKITGISVGFGKSAKCEVEVFISTNLSRDPAYVQKAVVKPNQFTVVELDTPYEIEGKRIFVGYRCKSTSTSDTPLACDFDEARMSSYGNWYTMQYPANYKAGWDHNYPKYGNTCVRAIIEGNVSGNGTAIPVAAEFPPVVRPGQDFTAQLTVLNNSAVELNDVEVLWNAGSSSGTFEWTFPTHVKAGARDIIDVTMNVTEEDDALPVQFSVLKVNGLDNYDAGETLSTNVCCSWVHSIRNVMVEKNTGVRCGWCPRGIVGFERMNEEVSDGSFIGVAVHNYSYGSDPMYCSSYTPWNDLFVGYGAPTATANRSGGSFDPSYEMLQSKFKSLRSVTFAGISLETSVAGSNADVVANVLFSKDLSGLDYGIGFVLVENELGPYAQNNNYANGSTPMGGFEKEGGVVMVTYNDVAREIFDWDGASNSLPSTVTAGTTYRWSRSLSLAKCKDVTKVKVIAFIVDRKTKEIVNSVRVSLGKNTGVDGVGAEVSPVNVRCVGNLLSGEGDFTSAAVYSLDGTYVSTLLPGESMELASGVFVVKIEGGSCGGKIFKVISR